MENTELSMSLISTAGRAKSDAIKAIRSAREGNFSAAEALLSHAEEELRRAHAMQTDMIVTEIEDGGGSPITIMMVHAQDHLMSAMTITELAKEFIFLYSLREATLKK